MTPRIVGETQRAYVERVLRRERRIATFDVLYNLAYANGRKCSITRLAAIIHTLRHEALWDIRESHEEGGLAVYRLVALRDEPSPEQLPEWQRGWSCVNCGAYPASSVALGLGDMGSAYCRSCGASRTFRRAA